MVGDRGIFGGEGVRALRGFGAGAGRLRRAMDVGRGVFGQRIQWWSQLLDLVREVRGGDLRGSGNLVDVGQVLVLLHVVDLVKGPAVLRSRHVTLAELRRRWAQLGGGVEALAAELSGGGSVVVRTRGRGRVVQLWVGVSPDPAVAAAVDAQVATTLGAAAAAATVVVHGHGANGGVAGGGAAMRGALQLAGAGGVNQAVVLASEQTQAQTFATRHGLATWASTAAMFVSPLDGAVYFGAGLLDNGRLRPGSKQRSGLGLYRPGGSGPLADQPRVGRWMRLTSDAAGQRAGPWQPRTAAGRGAQPVRVTRSSTGVRHLWVGLEPDQALAENVKVSANTLVVHAHGKNGAMSADPAKLKEEIAAAKLAGVDEVLLVCMQTEAQQFATDHDIVTWATRMRLVNKVDGSVFLGHGEVDLSGRLTITDTKLGTLHKHLPGGSGPVVEPGASPLTPLTVAQAKTRPAKWRSVARTQCG